MSSEIALIASGGIHRRLEGGGRYRATFGAGLTYRDDPVGAPGRWRVASHEWAEAGQEFLAESRGIPFSFPKKAKGVFQVQNRRMGTKVFRMQGAANVTGIFTAADEITYTDAWPAIDLVARLFADGIKFFFRVKAPGATSSIRIEFLGAKEESFVLRPDGAAVGVLDRDGEVFGEFTRPVAWISGRDRYGTIAVDGRALVYGFPDLSGASYPVLVDPTFTGNPASNAYDTMIYSVSAAAWSGHYAGTGSVSLYTSDQVDALVRLEAYTTSNQWIELRRGALSIDTSSILDTATLTSGYLRLFGSSSESGLGSTTVRVVGHTPATVGSYVGSDFNAFGGTILDSSGHTISSGLTTGDTATDFTLAAAGLSHINLTGYSSFGLRLGWDVSNAPPSWSSGQRTTWVFRQKNHGASTQPLLSVDYTTCSLPSSGAIRLNADIGAEYGYGGAVALGAVSSARGGSAGHGMSEFYGCAL